MPTYIAIITPTASGYQAAFADFPGLEARGASLDALRIEAEGVLEDHLAAAFGQEAVPQASTLEQAASKAPEGATLLAVTVTAPKSRAVSINITIPENLLAAIDRAAGAHNMSRSRYLAKAVEASVTGRRHSGVELPLNDEVLAAVDKAAQAHKMNRLTFLSGVIEVAVGAQKGHGRTHA
ncbi:type II toxin-antitoxin system HicB family antitoxin [Rhodoblastus acidophilus]|nr:type II toxin-antitoxin system HicB family antitoxin [Rhodoblastus acidophilus]